MAYKNGYIQTSSIFSLMLLCLFICLEPFLIILHAFVPFNTLARLDIIKFMSLFFLFWVVWFFLFRTLKIKVLSIEIFLYSLISLIVLFVYTLIGKKDKATFIYLYQYGSLSLTFFIFSTIDTRNLKLNSYVKFMRTIAWIIILFGIIEYFLPLEFFWGKLLKIQSFWAAKGDYWATIPLQYHGRFHSYEFQWIFGENVRRLTSLYADPTRLSPVLVILFNLFLFLPSTYEKKSDNLLLILLIIEGILTFSKFFYIAFCITLFFFFLNLERFMIKNVVILLFSVFVSIILFVFPIISNYLKLYLVAGFAHINGFFDAILNFKLFGYGLGYGGNYGKIYRGFSFGAESGMGSLISQIGIFSLIYLLLFNSITNKSIAFIKSSLVKNKFLAKFSLITIIEYFINFLFSESSLSASSNMLIFSIVLISLNLCKNER